MRLKKISLLLGCLFLLSLCFPSIVYADMGPKDKLTIKVENPPDEYYYLDLLTKEIGDYKNLDHSNNKGNINYNMIKLLYSYEEEGWLPAFVEGTVTPMYGSLTGYPYESTMIHEFGYVGLPDTYRIIIVTESGKVTISDIYTRKVLQGSIVYDYLSNQGTTPPLLTAYLVQFFSTCIPTLLIEFSILLLFGFSVKNNFKVFLAVNIITQFIMTAILGATLIHHGSISTYFMLFRVEILILLTESILYSKLLKGYSGKVRFLYGAVANLVSFIVGFFLISKQYEIIVSFLSIRH